MNALKRLGVFIRMGGSVANYKGNLRLKCVTGCKKCLYKDLCDGIRDDSADKDMQKLIKENPALLYCVEIDE